MSAAPRFTHVRDLLDAYVDDELPPAQAAAVAEHLLACAECSVAYEASLATVARLRDELPYYAAPDTLRLRIRHALRDAARHDAAGDDAAPEVNVMLGASSPRRPGWGARWSRRAAALLLAAVSASGATYLAAGRARPSSAEHVVAEEIVSSHIRALMPGHLTDVQSNDQHNVKPWFNGRLDFSPTVPRLDSLGFPLLGGRLDYVGGRSVAVVVYGRRRHLVSAYAWPAAGSDVVPASLGSSAAGGGARGYHALRWRAAGVEHWLVSDLNAAELAQLAALLRAAEAPPAPTR